MALILGISGTPRRGGNSEVLVQAILAGAAQQGAQTQAIFLRQYAIAPCVGCERCRQDKICTRLLDGMQLLYPQVVAATGLVLVSPVHNYNMSALMKAFIDRLYCFYDFSGSPHRSYTSRLAGRRRVATVAVVGEQPDEKELGVALPALRLPLEPLGYEVRDQLAVTGIFPPGQVAQDEEVMQKAAALGQGLAQALADSPGPG